MYGLIIFVHIIVCILLILVILIQRGRGGGLVESFSGFESMFGPKTSTFLMRLTTILAVIFMCSCLLLTFLSVSRSKSLLEKTGTKSKSNQQKIEQQDKKAEEVPKTE